MTRRWNSQISLTVALACLPLAAARGQALTVLIYDYSGLPDASMHQMKKTAGILLSGAGIRVDLVECSVTPPSSCTGYPDAGRVIFRILPDRPDGDRKVRHALASSVVPGAYGSLYAASIRKLATANRLHPGTVMGYALVHEIGHMLLGPAHAKSGIMRNPWGEGEIRAMYDHMLGFGIDEAVGMRAALPPKAPAPVLTSQESSRR